MWLYLERALGNAKINFEIQDKYISVHAAKETCSISYSTRGYKSLDISS